VTCAYFLSDGGEVARSLNYNHFKMSFPWLVLRGRAVTIWPFVEPVYYCDCLCQRICMRPRIHFQTVWFIFVVSDCDLSCSCCYL
jgi:hypothetical protein